LVTSEHFSRLSLALKGAMFRATLQTTDGVLSVIAGRSIDGANSGVSFMVGSYFLAVDQFLQPSRLYKLLFVAQPWAVTCRGQFALWSFVVCLVIFCLVTVGIRWQIFDTCRARCGEFVCSLGILVVQLLIQQAQVFGIFGLGDLSWEFCPEDAEDDATLVWVIRVLTAGLLFCVSFVVRPTHTEQPRCDNCLFLVGEYLYCGKKACFTQAAHNTDPVILRRAQVPLAT
jgi:hypothetical protein